jgi:hypothetical protein
MTTELARIETITPAELFKPGKLDPIMDAIEAEVRREAACLDISTEANRKALASLAFKVAKSKTFVEASGKDLVAGRKEELKAIDRERGRIWDRFEALQIEVRKPLTDWENAEKERVARHEAALQSLVTVGDETSRYWESTAVDVMRERLTTITATEYDWQEFISRAQAVVVVTIRQIKEAIARREKLESERAELETLRKEQAKRDQEAREAQIAKEATERAEWEAKRREEAAAKAAQAAHERVELEKAEAEARAKQAEAQRLESERLAALREKEHAEIAKRREEAAVVLERQRAAAAIEEATRKETEAAEKREANKRHCAKINREVLAAIVALMIPEPAAKKIVEAIAKGEIPHTKISY